MLFYRVASDMLHMRVQVKEALMTSALLKLPQSTPYSKKEERVEQILSELVSLRGPGCPLTHIAVGEGPRPPVCASPRRAWGLGCPFAPFI